MAESRGNVGELSSVKICLHIQEKVKCWGIYLSINCTGRIHRLQYFLHDHRAQLPALSHQNGAIPIKQVYSIRSRELFFIGHFSIKPCKRSESLFTIGFVALSYLEVGTILSLSPCIYVNENILNILS